MPQSSFATRLLRWYARRARALPFRGTPRPYRVWVSEIMLQQTRVETVLPYYRRWMRRFPTLKALAEANQVEVLRLWEGLGYYARARNLHRAAREVMRDHRGRLPSTVESLLSLPGIGRYTAGAIASIAFGRDVPAVDGNVKRVLARAFNIQEDIRSAAGEGHVWDLAGRLLPKGQAGACNQALMDLGATVCTARRPKCSDCPVRSLCQAYALGIQEQLPVRARRGPVPHYDVTAAVLRRNGRVLITRRPAEGLLGGLWEFPGGKVRSGESLATSLRRELLEELGIGVRVGNRLATVQHTFTHFRITLHAFECELRCGAPRALQAAALKWVYPSQLGRYTMGKADREVARQVSSWSVA